MPENNMECPPSTATNNAKAEWSALKALRENPEGMFKKDLVQRAHRDWPDNIGESRRGKQAVGAALQHLAKNGLVCRNTKLGKWQAIDVPKLARQQATEAPTESAKQRDNKKKEKQQEHKWYQPVADQLVNLGLCTTAESCGDDINGRMWTNPDVVGLIKPDPVAQIHNFPTRLVAVEIKRATDINSLLTGFAEACAYLVFAHISWLIVPWCENSPTIARVERLCMIHGLGLAYVHEEKKEAGDEEKTLWLEIGVHPRQQEPDLREFSDFLQRLSDKGIKL